MRRLLRTSLLVAGRDLRSRLRDRSALVVGVVAPVALALIISFAFGGGGGAFHARVGVVDDDRGNLSSIFIDEVLGSPGLVEVFTVVRYEDAEAAEAALVAGEIGAAFLLPRGVATLTVLRSATAPITGEIAAGVAHGFAAQATGVARAVDAGVRYLVRGPAVFGPAAADGKRVAFTAADVGRLAQEVADRPHPVSLADASSGASDVGAASYFGPGMALMFVFFLLGSAPRGLLAERELGTLARLRAAPVPIVGVVVGKALAVGAVGMASMLTVWAVTALVFGARWGDPLAVVALMLVFVIAALGIATAVAVYARTESQADGLITIVAFVLAMLGGNFVFLGNLPIALQRVALATPNGWALQGFVTLAADGGGVGSIAGPLAAIAAFGLVAYAVAIPGLARKAMA